MIWWNVLRHRKTGSGEHARRAAGSKLGRRIGAVAIAVLLLGLLIPENLKMPVAGAKPGDWNPRSFWYYPWGKSGVHKGVDIFAPKGRPVLSATPGLVIRCGNGPRGGNTVLVLGPKWRFHYYSHLDRVDVRPFRIVSSGERLGSVGNSGNAAGKPSHLHYAIATAIPYPWRINLQPQGWRRMFFLNPHDRLAGLK